MLDDPEQHMHWGPFPPKVLMGSSSPKVVEERRIKLEQWYATASPPRRCHHLSELVLPARSHGHTTGSRLCLYTALTETWPLSVAKDFL